MSADTERDAATATLKRWLDLGRILTDTKRDAAEAESARLTLYVRPRLDDRAYAALYRLKRLPTAHPDMSYYRWEVADSAAIAALPSRAIRSAFPTYLTADLVNRLIRKGHAATHRTGRVFLSIPLATAYRRDVVERGIESAEARAYELRNELRGATDATGA